MYQDICYDRYTEIKDNNAYAIVAERWLSSNDFGFHKWAGRKKGSGDLASHHSTTYPREITIVDQFGNEIKINLLNTADYEFAAGKITHDSWTAKKTMQQRKVLRILLPAGIILMISLLIFFDWFV